MQHTHIPILIIDFGSQLTKLIARRVRESGIYCEIIPFQHINENYLKEIQPKGIILSGSPSSILEDGPKMPEGVLEYGVPILGICYGQQLLVHTLGAHIETSDHKEFGRAFLHILESSPILPSSWKDHQAEVWMSHGDRASSLPNGFKAIAKSDNAPFALIAHEEKKIYATQFHPEVTHTPQGAELIKNFTHHICAIEPNWNMEAYLEQAIHHIKQKVGNKKVICGLSGGVDSSVTAVLVHKAIKDQLTCVFVDTGLMRLNEAEEVVSLFRDHYQMDLIHIEAEDLFLSKLKGVDDPEQKRKIIGATFIEIFEKEAAQIADAEFLAQGTLYPDVIESVSLIGGDTVIKSHHNVGGLPERMNLKLLEPLRELFKDEARSLGRSLGMDPAFIQRHPFPGPGLAIRIPGAVDKEKADILRQADAIYLEEIKKAGLYDEIWQAFAVLLPVRTVGVMGDSRTYDYVCALRAVTATDGMTADFYPFESEFLGHVSNRIINEVGGINRVVYDYTSKPPGTIEWE